MSQKLVGKTVLVTGGGRGIGEAICRRFALEGATVAVADIDAETAETTSANLPIPGLPIEMDVASTESIRQGMKLAISEFEKLDILVNNAGVNRPQPGLEVDVETWDDLFNINVRGGFFCAQAVAPGMIERGFGRVIFISSQSGLIGIPGQPVYCASKGAIVNLVRTLGVEWAKHGITVNSVAPTFVETNLTRARLNQPEYRAFVLGKIPRGELATPEDVACAVVYLASEEAGMVNCATLPVDGGWTAW